MSVRGGLLLWVRQQHWLRHPEHTAHALSSWAAPWMVAGLRPWRRRGGGACPPFHHLIPRVGALQRAPHQQVAVAVDHVGTVVALRQPECEGCKLL